MTETVDKIKSEASKQNVFKKTPIFVPASDDIKNKKEDVDLVEDPASLYEKKEGIGLINKPVGFTQSDKAFIEKCKDLNYIKRDKIKFTEKTIELNGLKFPRELVKYADVKDIPWLTLDKNVYKYPKQDYFTQDAVRKIADAGKKIPSTYQREHAADALGWKEHKASYRLLREILNYPQTGVDTQVWTAPTWWSDPTYYMRFRTRNDGLGNKFYWESLFEEKTGRSLIFLQN